jgi:hypothetical protein
MAGVRMICLRLCQPLMNLVATVYRGHAGYKPALLNFRNPLKITGGDGVVFFHLAVPILKMEKQQKRCNKMAK